MSDTTRRAFLGYSAGALLSAKEPERSVYWNRPPLAANRFAPLPLGSIRPRGWLLNQLRIQANGLSGHLDEFWRDLGPDSGWLGGTGESWERGPYFMDGLVPLAYLTGDPALIGKAEKWVRWTIEHPQASGMIGPDRGKVQTRQAWQNTDWWPNMVMLKVLTQYQEATGDQRVVPLMSAYLKHHLERAAGIPLVRWAAHRWADQVLAMVWLYNRTGDEGLLKLARVLHQQAFDWKDHFANFRFTGKVEKKDANLSTHVVNNAMAIKTYPVWWQISKDESDRAAVYRMLEVMDRYHLQAHGGHSGDEHYAGLDPSQGTELCSIVEAMYSLEQAIAILGDAAFGDRLERLAFNALPATFKADMWAHQYDQQVNQVLCSIDKTRNWTTNGPDANIFGLEPNFGCCTANMHQGWPKYVAHLWMATREKGLAAVAYGPSVVEARVGDGVPVSIEQVTDYPFKGEIRLKLSAPKPVRFPLQLRIPAWAEGARASVGGKPKPGTFFTIDREWKSGDTVELVLPMRVRRETHYRGSAVVMRGPLVFSLGVGEDWRKVRGQEPHADWEVHPATPWNYGLASAEPKVEEKAAGESPFSAEGAPVVIKARGRRLPEWGLVNGSAGPVPESPARSGEAEESLTLVPYGCARLRVTAFPRV